MGWAGGGGGGGGAGIVVLQPGVTLTNGGTVYGGSGGSSDMWGGAGGGGAGVIGNALAIVNTGTIAGGNGGTTFAVGGNGGAGIIGSGLTIINSGTIKGGTAYPVNSPGVSGVNGNAVTFTGGINSLELRAGSVIAGNVVGATGGGTANSLILGGDTTQPGGSGATTFNVSAIGNQYQNFTAFQKSGMSNWTLTGTTSEVTPWTISGGLLNFASIGSFGSGYITLNGGGLQWATGNATDISGRLNPIGVGGGVFDTNGNDVTFANSLTGGGGMAKTGGGTLTLIGANGYTGGTTINAGTLALSGLGSVASSSGVSIADNGRFDISATTSGAGIQSLSGGGNVWLGGKTLVLTNASGTFSGAIAGTGSLLLAGGTQTLSGTNSYTDMTAISAGATLALSGTGSISSSSVVAVANNAKFDISASTSGASIQSLSGAGSVVLGGQMLTLTNATGLFSGEISGTGGLTLTGGTETLAGTNTYTGGTTINDAIVRANAASALGGASPIGAYGALNIINGGALYLNAAQKVGALSGDSSAIISNQTGANTLVVNQFGDTTYAGSLQGDLYLTLNGNSSADTLTISGTNNTYTGNTIINSGTLVVDGTIDGTNAVLVNAGGTLSGSGTITTASTGGFVHVSSGGFVVPSAGTALTINGSVSVGGTTSVAADAQLSVSGRYEQFTGSTLDIIVGSKSPAITADSASLGGTLNIAGISSSSQLPQTLVSTTSGVSGSFSSVTVGGFAGTVDYMTVNTGKSTDGTQYLASYGLSWTANNNLGHGTFTLTNASDSFNVGTVLGNEAANAATSWDGISLTKAGAGTLILSANNTYTGGTTISSGTLQLGDGGTTGSILGNVTNDGTLAFNRSDDVVFGGVISGRGSVEQNGAGTATLTINNSYTGLTTVNAGTLAIASTGGVAGNVVNNATFNNAGAVGGGVANAANATLTQTGGSIAGGLANSGSVNANGGALNGAIVNNAGATFNVGGTVTSSDTFNNANGATLAVQATGDYKLAGNLTNSGTVTIDEGGSLTAGSITNTANGVVTNNGTVIDDLDNAGFYTNNKTQNSNVASNSGTIVNSLGATWNGNFNTSGTVSNLGTIDGSLTQSAGITTNNGSITGAVIVNGGVFFGTGSVGLLTIANGATIAPSDNGSVGTMSVAGNMVFAQGSTYQVAINTAGQASRIDAAGTATINGGTVAVMAGQGSYNPRSTATILSAQGGVSGRFDGVTSNLAFLTPTLSYDSNDVYLVVTRNNVNFADVATTPNQTNVANAITALMIGNPVWDAVVGLDTRTARVAFDQLSGEVHASGNTALIEDSRFVRDAALDRLRSGACSASGGTTSLSVIEPNGGRADFGCDSGQAVTWARGFGSWGDINGDGNAASIHRSIGGLLMGVDSQLLDSWRVGVLGGYSRSSFNVNDRMSSGSSDNYSLGLYAGSQWGNFAFRSGAAYTWHDISTSRGVAFPGFSDSLSGDYNAGTTQLFGELGYGINAGAVTFEPFANLAYVNLHTDGFAEKGGVAALTANSGNTDTTFSTLGLNLSSDIMLGGLKATASGSLGWRHAFGGIKPVSAMALAGSSDFSIAGAPIVRDAAVINAGLDLAVSPNAVLGVSYSGQLGSGIADNSIRGDFKLSF
ncbi:hypothetical protein C7I85_24570 [Mesorhizobium soli]|uniref:Autotransporter domain-containing protein n=2 Tax=Pseudaminobacter soli (ex Li et al. 2025) TaxID=1295366 RepID=A0A2P7S200_9HYPH|nr:hypothetical protein C7I85_24570 [Mesorhizobium soli]